MRPTLGWRSQRRWRCFAQLASLVFAARDVSLVAFLDALSDDLVPLDIHDKFKIGQHVPADDAGLARVGSENVNVVPSRGDLS